VFSTEHLYIDGVLEGRIELPAHKLTVGPQGTIKTGVIHAGTVVVLRAVLADVNARDKVEIYKNGTLKGNIKTARIAVDEG
jgi:cytoskeletal protein CcmA (bactofilin family)